MNFDATSTFVELFTLSSDTSIEKVTEPEALCVSALGDFASECLAFPQNGGLDTVLKRQFTVSPELVPQNWSECIAAAKYWSTLIALRESSGVGPGWKHVGLAHQQFCLELLAETTIEDADEAIVIIEHLETDAQLMAHPDMGAVVKNLVARPRTHER